MAHRELRRSRVLVAAAGLFVGLAVLWLRLGWIQLAQHRHFMARAEQVQEQRVLLKPVRGSLLDRRGRPLARDLLAYSVTAAPRETRDPSAVAVRLARVLGQSPARLRREFARRPRFLWVARRVSPARAQAVAALEERGVYLSFETQRDRPLGAAAAEVLGRTDLDNVGVEGLESQFDPVLRGRPGWTTEIRDGRGRRYRLPRATGREPEDGHSLVLSLDAELQALVEVHLAAVVDSLEALCGGALFLDPATGQILAMACWPHRRNAAARNLLVSDQYEPGSTFKVVVMAAALEEGLADPGEKVHAENGAYRFGHGAVIRDAHPHGVLTLADAFRFSSNIVMGKLARRVGDERLYRYATSMGFGSLTGIEFPGETAGQLRTPDRWSGRSGVTIAIGQEVSCTALQLALSYAAIANGGVLMQPQLVLEERDAAGRPLRRRAPQAVQRVCGEATARLLRAMMQSVVDSGTAKSARVPGLAVAGKTGTAQKYDAGVGTYGRGKYVSSFVGFAPAEGARILGLVVIDEPRAHGYYGGDVAAPVFRRIVEDLRQLPAGPLRPTFAAVAVRPPAPSPVSVPDLRLLPWGAARAELAALGLRALAVGSGPRVVAQEPAPGAAVERGERVMLWLAAGSDSASRALPDLRGLSARDALRALSRRQVAGRVVGSGVVARQVPGPGTPLPLRAPCVLYCEPLDRAAGVAGPADAWVVSAR